MRFLSHFVKYWLNISPFGLALLILIILWLIVTAIAIRAC